MKQIEVQDGRTKLWNKNASITQNGSQLLKGGRECYSINASLCLQMETFGKPGKRWPS